MKTRFNDSVHSETPLAALLHLLHLLAQTRASECGLMMSPLAPRRLQISPIPLFAVIIHTINAFILLIDN